MSERNNFPFFSQAENQDLVYLDSAATTQKPVQVINTISDFYTKYCANVHRGSYQLANNLTQRYEESRKNVAQFINAKSHKDIVWTQGTTDAINLVALSWGQQHIKANDHILVLASEHHANFVPWQQLAQQIGAHIHFIPLLENGDADLKAYQELLSLSPKFIALQHCSNVLGNIHDVSKMVKLAKAAGATTLIDGAQAVAHLPVDVQQIGCDFYCFSGHKMYGPTGIGVLYIAESIKEDISAARFGGEMVQSVKLQQTEFRPLPSLLETGTPNVAGVLGLSAAVDYVTSLLAHNKLQHSKELHQYLVQKLNNISHVTLFGNDKNNIGIVSFVVDGESISDVSMMLDQQNIALRAGFHCAMPLMNELNVTGTLRVSLAIYNNQQDVDLFIKALKEAIEILVEE